MDIIDMIYGRVGYVWSWVLGSFIKFRVEVVYFWSGMGFSEYEMEDGIVLAKFVVLFVYRKKVCSVS